MYIIKAVTSVKKDLRKIQKQLISIIKDKYLLEIKSNPYISNNLHGEFSKLKSFHFKYNAVDYRIIYEIFEPEKIIRILMISSRANIYKKLKLRLD